MCWSRLTAGWSGLMMELASALGNYGAGGGAKSG